MRFVAFDTETSLIRTGRTAPPLVCLSFATATGDAQSGWSVSDGELHAFADGAIRDLVIGWLLDPEVVIVGHNVLFDLAVLCAEWPELVALVFAAFKANRITDTRTRHKLLDIARGKYRGFLSESGKWIKLGYTLQELARRVAGIPIKKEGFRMFYGPLRDVPLERWVEEARLLQEAGAAWLEGDGTRKYSAALAQLAADFGDTEKFRTEVKGMVAADAHEVITYPIEDATSTGAVCIGQEAEAEDLLEDQYRQVRNAWWKHLTSAWGLRTNPRGVAKLQMQTERACEEVQAKLVAEGLVRKDGSRDTKKAKARMLAVCGWQWVEGLGKYEPVANDIKPLRLTDAGEPSLDSDACKAADDEVLKLYAELTSLKAVLNKDVPALARATVFPVHTNFDLAETGRTTSSNPNVQNWRRLPGIRECFVPRPGKVFAQADYSSLELCTLAQACIDLLGYSTLGDAINEGLDPHTALACSILGIDYAAGIARKEKSHPLHKEFDNARQTAKVANFGFPGGLGAEKLCLFARKTYQVELTVERARQLKQQWLSQWPEMREYFAFVNGLQGEDGTITLTQLRSNRVRGGATYTAACNSFFQGLGADATGNAGWLIAYACYVDTSSPLYGSRIVNYVHDEFIVETDEANGAAAAEELSRLMVLGAQEWIPSIKLAAEPCLMTVWSKDAKTLRDPQTRKLVAWSPEPEIKEAA